MAENDKFQELQTALKEKGYEMEFDDPFYVVKGGHFERGFDDMSLVEEFLKYLTQGTEQPRASYIVISN